MIHCSNFIHTWDSLDAVMTLTKRISSGFLLLPCWCYKGHIDLYLHIFVCWIKLSFRILSFPISSTLTHPAITNQMNLLLIFNISVWGQKHLWQVGIDPCQHVLLNGLGAGPERGHCLFFIHKLTHVRINSTMKMLFSSIRHLVRHLNTPSLKHSAHK